MFAKFNYIVLQINYSASHRWIAFSHHSLGPEWSCSSPSISSGPVIDQLVQSELCMLLCISGSDYGAWVGPAGVGTRVVNVMVHGANQRTPSSLEHAFSSSTHFQRLHREFGTEIPSPLVNSEKFLIRFKFLAHCASSFLVGSWVELGLRLECNSINFLHLYLCWLLVCCGRMNCRNVMHSQILKQIILCWLFYSQ